MADLTKTSNRFRCPKLTNENWKAWSALVRTHLESKDLLDTIMPPLLPVGTITGTVSDARQSTTTDPADSKLEAKGDAEQPTTIDLEGLKREARKDATARTIIMMYAGPDRLGYILGFHTAYEQWETLRKVHEPTGQHRLATLLQSFYGYKLQPKNTINKTASDLTSVQSNIWLIDPGQALTN
jgi:hypothetical protein